MAARLILLGALFLGAGILFLILRRAAGRYEAEQRRLGNWDEKGPLYVSQPPPASTRSYRMEWILEARGLWRSRRRPRSDSSPSDS